MKKLEICALLSIIFVYSSGCTTKAPHWTSTKKAESLTIKTYSAPDTSFFVNSHLVLGKKEALLIDAQLTRSAARKLGTMIRESDRKLTTIFITHAHPDHYLGLEVFGEQFPNAQIIARPKVVAEIKRTAEAKRQYWKGIFKDDMADSVVVPQPYEKDEIMFAGNPIQLFDFDSGESDVSTVLYFPSIKTVATGDNLYNGVHLWLADESGSIDGWLKNLRRLRHFEDVENFLPGHGRPGGSILLDQNEKYLQKFSGIVENAETSEQAASDLKTAFPDYQMPLIADMSTALWFKKFGKHERKENTPAPSPMIYH